MRTEKEIIEESIERIKVILSDLGTFTNDTFLLAEEFGDELLEELERILDDLED